ncbi:MAG: ECF transporter S component [Bacillota bacterium]|nr:ECF transporter S component [Clostridia bacterium]
MEDYFKPKVLKNGRRKNKGLQFITKTAVLLAIVLAVQSLRLPSYITGPAVNCVLILATVFTGVWSGITIGCITPGVGLFMGIIPPAAAPLVPVIVAANITFVFLFSLLDKLNRYFAWLGAAFGKFGVFYICLNFLLDAIGIKVPAPLVVAFQLPQLYTALAGGLLAVIIARYLRQVLD